MRLLQICRGDEGRKAGFKRLSRFCATGGILALAWKKKIPRVWPRQAVGIVFEMREGHGPVVKAAADVQCLG